MAALGRASRDESSLALLVVVAASDVAHEPLEPVRRLGAQIRVVHAAQLLGDGKQRLSAQANDVVVRLFVLVRHGHRGPAKSALSRKIQAAAGHQQRFTESEGSRCYD